MSVEPVDAAAEAENERLREEALAYAEQNVPAEGEDFMEFWAAQKRKATKLRNVFGVDVELPPSLPLDFELQAKAVEDSQDENETKKLIGVLFGDEALDHWTRSGIDLDQFAVLLLWGTANTRRPNSLTLGRAFQIYEKRMAELEAEALAKAKAAGEEEVGAGKAPAAVVTQKTPGRRSAATGGRSKRTSRASTA